MDSPGRAGGNGPSAPRGAVLAQLALAPGLRLLRLARPVADTALDSPLSLPADRHTERSELRRPGVVLESMAVAARRLAEHAGDARRLCRLGVHRSPAESD